MFKVLFVSLCLTFLGFSLLSCKANEGSISSAKMMGRNTAPIPLEQAPPGTVVFAYKDQQKAQPFCSGVSIKEGVVLTAEHCLKPQKASYGRTFTYKKINLIFSPSEVLTLSSENSTIARHPQVNLALIFFDPTLLKSPPTVAELSSPAEGELPDLIFQNATFYGPGGFIEYPRHQNTSDDQIFVRGSKKLTVLTTNQKKGLEKLATYLDENPTEGADWIWELTYLTREGLKCDPSDLALRPWFLRPALNWLCSKRPHVELLVSANLRQNKKLPGGVQEALICPADAGGGLRNAQGKLIGIAQATTYGFAVTYEENSFNYDPEALALGCSPLGLFTNLHTHYSWIQDPLATHHHGPPS